MAEENKINPWGASEPERLVWETVAVLGGPAVYRMRLPNGWLYRLEKSTAMTFVPS